MKSFLNNCAETPSKSAFTPASPIRFSKIHHGAIQDAGRVHQATDALVAHAVEQLVLHLFIGQVVEAPQDQDSCYRPGRVWRVCGERGYIATRSDFCKNSSGCFLVIFTMMGGRRVIMYSDTPVSQKTLWLMSRIHFPCGWQDWCLNNINNFSLLVYGKKIRINTSCFLVELPCLSGNFFFHIS